MVGKMSIKGEKLNELPRCKQRGIFKGTEHPKGRGITPLNYSINLGSVSLIHYSIKGSLGIGRIR